MTNDGGPAFPSRTFKNVSVDPDHPVYADGHLPGMSLRDYFAAHAPHLPLKEVIQALLVRSDRQDATGATEGAAADLAEWAYIYADAMMKRRSM
jgi:hypothetical protein